MGKLIDIPKGSKFGRWTTLGTTTRSNSGAILWECQCVCGTILGIAGNNLRRGALGGCRACNHGTPRLTHGYSTRVLPNGKKAASKTYRCWRNMASRCYNGNNIGYHLYGRRGITVCDSWRGSFENFLADMGECPSPKHSVDRINNDGNYEPGNCRWATMREQGLNTRKTIRVMWQGKLTPLRQVVAEHSTLPFSTVVQRLQKLNWPLDKALTAPAHTRKAKIC